MNEGRKLKDLSPEAVELEMIPCGFLALGPCPAPTAPLLLAHPPCVFLPQVYNFLPLPQPCGQSSTFSIDPARCWLVLDL